MAVADICRKGGFSDPTIYKWRAKFGGMDASEARSCACLQSGAFERTPSCALWRWLMPPIVCSIMFRSRLSLVHGVIKRRR